MGAIIFDFDGTLVDTEPLHERALRISAEPMGATVEEGASIGLSDEDAMAQALSASGVPFDDDLIRRLCLDKTAAYTALLREEKLVVYEGAVELLREAGRSARVGVCTAAVLAEVAPALEGMGIANDLDVLVTADDVARKKPDPECYIEVCRRLGLDPASVVAIEDSPRGVSAAKGAGLHVVAVGHTTRADSLGEADHFVRRISELTAEGLLARCAAAGRG